MLLEVNGAGLSDELKGRILAEAAGNPLALIELPPAAADLDLTSASEPLPLTARLEAAFATRLTALDADVRALLLLAALDDGELAELSRAAEALLGARIDVDDWTMAVASGLGTLGGGGFRFRHPLIRSAVHQAATSEERRLAHAALAEADERMRMLVTASARPALSERPCRRRRPASGGGRRARDVPGGCADPRRASPPTTPIGANDVSASMCASALACRSPRSCSTARGRFSR